jgi:hypothetical protein
MMKNFHNIGFFKKTAFFGKNCGNTLARTQDPEFIM